MPILGLYGPLEVEYYTLTQTGVQRLQSGSGRLEPGLRVILEDLYKMGGTAELDELKFGGGGRTPTLLRSAITQLVDMGLIAPVSAGPQGPASTV